MIYIGNHVSIAGGFLAMGRDEENLGGNTFAFFTRNPRGGKTKTPDAEDMQALQSFLKEHSYGPLVAHAPYTMNVCAVKEGIRDYSRQVLVEDLQLMESLPGQYLNFHPGSHVGQGVEEGIRLVADALEQALTPDMTTTVLLETMAGKGTEIGRSFEELRAILDLLSDSSHVGVCLDTCHIWDGGYDIAQDLDGVLTKFDQVIGLNRLKAIHLNDSLNVCGAHKDRHAKIGEGEIGAEALKRVVQHPALQGLPFILETPNDDEGYKREIELVKSWMV